MRTLSGKSPLASAHFVTLEPRMNTVLIYVDTNKEVGDVDLHGGRFARR